MFDIGNTNDDKHTFIVLKFSIETKDLNNSIFIITSHYFIQPHLQIKIKGQHKVALSAFN